MAKVRQTDWFFTIRIDRALHSEKLEKIELVETLGQTNTDHICSGKRTQDWTKKAVIRCDISNRYSRK